MFQEKQSYTATEGQRAYEQLDQLVAQKAMNPTQAGAYRRHIVSRVQVTLKPPYPVQVARRAKAEIVKLTEARTVTMKSAAAYRAHSGTLIPRTCVPVLTRVSGRCERSTGLVA